MTKVLRTINRSSYSISPWRFSLLELRAPWEWMIFLLRLLQVFKATFRCHRFKLISPNFTGCAVAWGGKFKEETEKESFSAIVDLMANCACFIYIGAWLDFQAFNSPQFGITPWKLFILFLWIMVFRRIPAVLVLYRWVPEIHDWRKALFTGHFGKHCSSKVPQTVDWLRSRTCKSRDYPS